MKIAIRTLPFRNNYGGILQNYALQKVLQDLNHESITIDSEVKENPWWVYCLSWIKTALLFFTKKRRSFAKFKKKDKQLPSFALFVKQNIKTNQNINLNLKKFVCSKSIDVIIVGSDQVWRPKYSGNIYKAFLNDVKTINVKRIAYAASFGVDIWEYSKEQTFKCSILAKKFNAISVREQTGVELCKKNLDIKASLVLDPTLLLDKKDYFKLCEDISSPTNKYLAAYILGSNETTYELCEKIAKEKNLSLKYFSADSQATLSIPEWLAMFRDASYVVTDSFHGTVFSIIFGKEFKCIYNNARGAARFESLLNLYNSGKLEEMRQFSLNWLKRALES